MIEPFGTLPDGGRVERITLQGGGLSARFLTWGAVLQDLRLAGHAPPLVLGLESLDDYLAHSRHFGATVGRCANRIRDGRCTIAGRPAQLDRNEGVRHHLHGGTDNAGRKLWRVVAHAPDALRLALTLPDGHMGYPGTLQIEAAFTLAGDGVLNIEYTARTDGPTLCNLAHHSYFDLDGAGDARGHALRIAADAYLPVDDDKLPLGAPAPVAGTGFDFRAPRRLRGEPLDHNFCLADRRGALREVAMLEGRDGVKMALHTTEPGLQVYDGHNLDVPVPGLAGQRIGPHAGIALEPQVWPDSPNHPDYPQALLRPGETYRQHTRLVFGRAQSRAV